LNAGLSTQDLLTEVVSYVGKQRYCEPLP